MKCNDVDIIGYLEGNAPEDVRRHIESCEHCSVQAEHMKKCISFISTCYAAGKPLETELHEMLNSIDMNTMKKLPEKVSKRVHDLKEKSIAEKLKKVLGKGRKNVKEMVENIMIPQMSMAPASPKDITKTKKKRKTGKKND
jgi:ribosomal protein L12E/L44/L45/RPP1/RPP2